MAAMTLVSPSTTAQLQTRGSAGDWVQSPFIAFSTMPFWHRTAGDQCGNPNQTSSGTGLAGTRRRTMLRPGCLHPVLLSLLPPCLCDHKTELPPACGGLASPSPGQTERRSKSCPGEFFLGSMPTLCALISGKSSLPGPGARHPHCVHPRTHCYPTAS